MIYNFRNILLVLTITFFSYGAGLYSKPPKWAISPEDYYDKEKYLIGVGEGDTLENAKSAAFASLASIFGTTIEQDIRSTETLTDESSSSSIQQDIRLASQHNLVNVKIDKTYNDKREKTYYAIAVMDKEKTVVILESMIFENLKDVASYANQAKDEPDLLKKYALLDYAISISIKNEVYVSQIVHLDIIKANSISTPSTLTTQALRSEAARVTNKITFSISMSPEASQIVAPIKKVLGNMNMRISSNNPTYQFEDSFDTKGSEIYGLYTMDYTLVITLKNTQTGEAIKTFTFEGKDLGNDQSDATKNAMNSLSQTIEKTLESQFSGYLNEILK